MTKDKPTRMPKPDAASGREIHAQLARSGPPLEITVRGLPRRFQPRLSIEEALSARPDGKADKTKG